MITIETTAMITDDFFISNLLAIKGLPNAALHLRREAQQRQVQERFGCSSFLIQIQRFEIKT